jgi:RNA polymerase sigma-70 factor (ECF subfamily)
MSPAESSVIATLLRRIKRGDRNARKELFAIIADEREFGAVMYTMARRLLPGSHWARRLVDSRDVVQSALCSGWRHLSDFRGETEGELCNWLRAIMRTKIQRVTRRKRPEPEGEPCSDESDQPLSRLVEREFIELLHAAIGNLPLDQRVVVELRLRGISATEIGETLGLNPATVRQRESRAVKRLRADLGQ